MSTILDSLKKSSDLRNNTDGGSLNNFNFGNDKESSSAFSKIIVVLLILLILAVAFWAYQNYFASNEHVSTTEIVSTNSLKQGAGNTEGVAKIVAQEGEHLQQVDKKERPSSDAIKAQIKKLKELKEQKKLGERKANLADLNRNNSSFVKNNRPTSEINEATKSNRSLVKTDKYKMDELKLAQATKPERFPKPVEQIEKKNASTEPIKPANQYRLIYQLPFAVRKEIPEIKLNIHVYDEEPGNRIAIINGTRFAIDDMITDQLLLKDIVVDGILLDYNGTEFFVPN